MKTKKPPQLWQGCYQDSWQGIITPASFAHPAKFSKKLIERILDYLAERKWISRGDAIGDPFGGVGTGAIVAAYRGYFWIGQELEEKFFELGAGNFGKHCHRWARLGVPAPILIHGDSRFFHENVSQVLQAVVSSPPYVSGGHHVDVMDAGNKNGRGQKMKAIVSSPAYSGSLDDGGPEKAHPDGYDRTNNWTGYGKSAGQIARLRTGDIDAVVGSPPFLGARSDTTSSGGGINKAGYEGKSPARPSHKRMGERTYQSGNDSDREKTNIENLPPGDVEAIVTSPAYETISAGAGGLNHLPPKESSPGQQSGRRKGASQSADQTYGKTPGQISHTKTGSVDVVLTSPAYADSINSQSHGIDFSKSKPGGVMAIVVKDFVKDKRRMPLCDDTMRLLVWLGFEEVERIHAMLTEEQIHEDMFEGTRTKRKEKKSFFRRLHESRLAPDDPRRIDYEEVLIVRKPA
jgi:hypothetical protein